MSARHARRRRRPSSQAVAGSLLAAAVAVPLTVDGGGSWIFGGPPPAEAATVTLTAARVSADPATDRAARQDAVQARGDAHAVAVQEATAQEAAAQQAAEQQAAEQQAAAARAAEVAAAQERASRSSGDDPRSIARSMLAARGQAGEFGCLDRLWERESGWSPNASNASSGAYGIPQSLPGWKMASAGSDWRTNPATQIRWGIQYIADSYGSPCGAWRHSQGYGWY